MAGGGGLRRRLRGVTGDLGERAAEATGGDPPGTATAPAFGSVALSTIIDTLPFEASVSPVVSGTAASPGGADEAGTPWWTFPLGADPGGDATVVASPADAVVIGIAEREGRCVSFREFSRYGLIVTAATVTIAAACVGLRHFVLV